MSCVLVTFFPGTRKISEAPAIYNELLFSSQQSGAEERETEFYTLHLFLEIKPLFYFSQGLSTIHLENCKSLFHWKKMITISVTAITIYTAVNLPTDSDMATTGFLPELPKE